MRRIFIKALLFSTFFLLSLQTFGQIADPKQRLKDLASRIATERQRNQAEIKKFADENNLPLSFVDANGNLVLLDRISDAGEPIYIKLDNAAAAATSGANELWEGGSLGIDIQGEGMIVGVWDGGVVQSHDEFGSRLLSTQGASFSSHATHVTGTIIAAGLNPSAHGMAARASAYTWDFDNDEQEMVSQLAPDQSTLLLSNHSYGLISGWYFNNGTWQWFGNSAVSTSEDYKFGYYSSNAKLWDEIAFESPYYTIVKSAGNERTDTGNGTFPADCNNGAGYDCVADVATAKNIITVGAIAKLPNYTGPASVQMSSFSSWGPTDDGRIKPDIVAAGVGLFSTNSTATNAYTNLSGTSMATPSTTGSLVLLQELHKRLFDSYMRASTLKALVIQTAREAGPGDGPDYRHGWGVLNVEAGARHLIEKNDINVVVSENSLSNGEEFYIEIAPKAGTKITATIVWTDLPGTVLSPVLDAPNRALVNDLDIRLLSDGDEVGFPWKLNPGNPDDVASKNDNDVDNVEKLEFDDAEEVTYKIRVSHKGVLSASQNYSLILHYTPASDDANTYYWIGNNGGWNDPAHWSRTSGGTSAGSIPDENDRVIFDNNSFSSGSPVITITPGATCRSLLCLSDANATLAFDNTSLTIHNEITMINDTWSSQGDGQLIFQSSMPNSIVLTFAEADFSSLDLSFDGGGNWSVLGDFSAQSISLLDGNLEINDTQIDLKELNASASNTTSLSCDGCALFGLLNSTLDGETTDVNLADSELHLAANATLQWDNIDYQGSLIIGVEGVEIFGDNAFNELLLDGSVLFHGNNSVEDLTAAADSELSFAAGTVQTVTGEMVLNSEEDNEILLTGVGGVATLNVTGYRKLCFDHLIVSNVNLEGEAIVNIGQSSELTNGNNWLTIDCDDVLFADFTYAYNCENAISEFTDASEGTVTSWSWDFNDGISPFEQNSGPNAYHMFQETGTFDVTLTVTNNNQSVSVTRTIEVIPNSVPENKITLSNNKLFSVKSAADYRWYKNYDLIENETQRGMNYPGDPAAYYVVTYNVECNRVSEPYIIASVEKPSLQRLTVGPVPSNGTLNVSAPSNVVVQSVRILDVSGKEISSRSADDTHRTVYFDAKAGIYVVLLNTNMGLQMRKIMVK